jgi:hypothetical protein
MRWDELRFSNGGSASETGKSDQEVKTACSTILLKLAANGLQHVFEKWVERCKKCIACQGRYWKKRPSPRLHKVRAWINKVSPRTLQTALVFILFEASVYTSYVHAIFVCYFWHIIRQHLEPNMVE